MERIAFGRQFCPGKTNSKVGKTKPGKVKKWMLVVDGQGAPLGKHLYSASSNKVRFVEKMLASILVTQRGRNGEHAKYHCGFSRNARMTVVHCSTAWRREASSWSPLIAEIEARRAPIIVERCAAAERWNTA